MQSLSWLREERSRRSLALIALSVVLPSSLGCASWQHGSIVPAPITREKQAATTDPSDLEGRQVRFHLPSGVVELIVTEVTFPYARGYHRIDAHRKTVEEVDLREVSFIEVRHFNKWKALAGVVVMSVYLVWLCVALTEEYRASN